jgi:FkbM family methyltransferase
MSSTLQDLVESAPASDAFAAFVRAGFAADRDRWIAAAEELAASLRLAPGDDVRGRLAAVVVQRLLATGVAAHQASRLDEAAANYRAALALEPLNVDARHMLALIRKHTGDPVGALAELATLVRGTPYQKSLHHNLSNTMGLVLKQAHAAAAQGRTAEAERGFAAAAAAGEGDFAADHPLSNRGYDIDPAAPVARRAELAYANVHGHILHDDFLDYLSRDANVFECGGADGEDSVVLAELFSGGTVYTVEGSAREFEILSRRIAGVPNIRAFNLLISDKTEDKTFYVYNSDIGRNTLAPPPPGQAGAFSSRAVRAVSLEDWAVAAGATRIDLFWLDMEGFELKALRGAEGLLKGAKVVYAEVSDEPLHGDPEACRFVELRDWLAERGFVVERELRPWQGGGNVLFVRKELSRRAA